MRVLLLVAFVLAGCAATPPRTDCGGDCQPCCPGGVCYGAPTVACLGGSQCASGRVCDAGPPRLDAAGDTDAGPRDTGSGDANDGP